MERSEVDLENSVPGNPPLDDLEGLLDEALEGFDASHAIPYSQDQDPEATPDRVLEASTSQQEPSLAFDPLRKPASGAKKRAPRARPGLDKVSKVPDDLAKEMSKLMRELSHSTTGEPEMVDGEERIMDLAATLSSLANKTRDTAGPETVPESVNDAMFAKVAEQIDSLQENGDMQSLVDSLMEQLLSKEVLYQPMRDIASRYPEWLQANRDALSAEDLDKYERQHRKIQRVCELYETEPTNFEKLVSLMQEVQACGQPPSEIVQELAPGMRFGSDGMPAFPSIPGDSAESCAVQ
mmetsp:Transcript_9356/g.22524  ORF Transcript_9356/g.22524 Transcript_9356/m.22524 type:complete len:295 (+) Transcript_9356:123-1007(+)